MSPAEEIEFLRERVRQLEQLLCDERVAIPINWQLTRSQSKLFAALVTRPIMTKDAAMTALYGDRLGDWPEEIIVDVHLCSLRKKLNPHGIKITVHWGQGWSLESHVREQFARPGGLLYRAHARRMEP